MKKINNGIWACNNSIDFGYEVENIEVFDLNMNLFMKRICCWSQQRIEIESEITAEKAFSLKTSVEKI